MYLIITLSWPSYMRVWTQHIMQLSSEWVRFRQIHAITVYKEDCLQKSMKMKYFQKYILNSKNYVINEYKSYLYLYEQILDTGYHKTNQNSHKYVNKIYCWKRISSYQFLTIKCIYIYYLLNENKINVTKLHNNRMHVCKKLYL